MKRNKFCDTCPLKLTQRPNTPCSKALDRIYAIQAAKAGTDHDSLPGCPWAINSAMHNYCFWNLATELDEPLTDKEICNYLGINPATLNKITYSAVHKLKNSENADVINDLIEAVSESVLSQNNDNTVYLPDSYTSFGQEEEEVVIITEKPKREDNSLPTHRSGKKKDIYGIYGKKKLQEMARKRHETKK